jgi:hypothetical protein
MINILTCNFPKLKPSKWASFTDVYGGKFYDLSLESLCFHAQQNTVFQVEMEIQNHKPNVLRTKDAYLNIYKNIMPNSISFKYAHNFFKSDSEFIEFIKQYLVFYESAMKLDDSIVFFPPIEYFVDNWRETFKHFDLSFRKVKAFRTSIFQLLIMYYKKQIRDQFIKYYINKFIVEEYSNLDKFWQNRFFSYIDEFLFHLQTKTIPKDIRLLNLGANYTLYSPNDIDSLMIKENILQLT